MRKLCFVLLILMLASLLVSCNKSAFSYETGTSEFPSAEKNYKAIPVNVKSMTVHTFSKCPYIEQIQSTNKDVIKPGEIDYYTSCGYKVCKYCENKAK